MTRLLIAASGTGGHRPALTVAKRLKRRPRAVAGGCGRARTSLVPERFGLITVNAGGLQGNGLKKLVQLIRLLLAIVSVRRVIRRESIVLFSPRGLRAAPHPGGALVRHSSRTARVECHPRARHPLAGSTVCAVAIGLPVQPNTFPVAIPSSQEPLSEAHF